MNAREKTKPIKVGNVQIGNSNEVIIQSMANKKTSQVDDVLKQIQDVSTFGSKIMRLSVLDEDDARAFSLIKKKSPLPLIADIHMDYRLAILALENGADAIRINPGNIGSIENIKKVVSSAKKYHAPIRIGVNGGSLDKEIYEGKETIKASYLFESAKKHVALLENLGFFDIVISLKGSDALETIDAYRLASSYFPYPLHLGVTEAGPMEVSLLRSAAALSPLLLEGIGDTIRISLSEEPFEEAKAASRLLHDLRLNHNWSTFISCPTCGRTQVNLIPLAKKVMNYLETHHIFKTVAIMGCVVNGPGEAKHADLGAAGGKGYWAIFKKGVVIKTVSEADVYNTLIEEIQKL